jgi:hypothetical protein
MKLDLSIADLLALVINQSTQVTGVAQQIQQGNNQVTLNTLGATLKRLNEIAAAFAASVEAAAAQQGGGKPESVAQPNGAEAAS